MAVSLHEGLLASNQGPGSLFLMHVYLLCACLGKLLCATMHASTPSLVVYYTIQPTEAPVHNTRVAKSLSIVM